MKNNGLIKKATNNIAAVNLTAMGMIVVFILAALCVSRFFIIAALLIGIAVVLLFPLNLVIYDLFFLVSFASVYKFDANSLSFFTILVFMLVFREFFKNPKIDLKVFVVLSAYFLYLLLGCLIGGNWALKEIVKQIANLAFLYFIARKKSMDIEQLTFYFLMGIVISSAIALCATAIPNFYSFVPKVITDGVVENRFSGLYSDPNYYSINIILAIALLYGLYKYNRIHYVLFWTGIVCLTFFGLQTYSKSFFLMYAIMMIFVVCETIKKKNKIMIGFLIFGGVFACVLWLVGLLPQIDGILNRLFSSNGISGLTTGRTDLWVQYLQYIFADISIALFGVGLGAPTLGLTVHNFYLELLYNLGIFGSCLFICAIYTCLRCGSNKKFGPFKKAPANYLGVGTLFVMYFFLSLLFAYDLMLQIYLAYFIFMHLGEKQKSAISEQIVAKNIYILTSEESFHNNYGALYQGYALNNILLDMGYNAQIIRYEGESRPSQITILKNPVTRALKDFINHLKMQLKRYKYGAKAIEKQEQSFYAFQGKNMRFWNEEKCNYKQLCANAPDAFAYVCGSDQIWNPTFRGDWCERGYFLNFGKQDVRRIAYAPSLGVNKVSAETAETMRGLLANFDAISVREEAGKEILEEITGENVSLLLDPTLVYEREKWLGLAKPIENLSKDYILLYYFSNEHCLKEAALKIAEKENLEIISVPLSGPSYTDEFRKIFASPEEFIYLIKNAKLVCTDSFHATVFSIIAETPFLTFPRENLKAGINMNSRIENLLSMTNLGVRMVESIDQIDFNTLFSMDFTEAHANIDVRRQEALAYLRNALKVDNVAKLTDAGLYCTACSSCVNACPTKAISMRKNLEGFSYPVVDENKCTHCNLCVAKCPIHKKQNGAAFADLDFYECYAKDDEVRTRSSSGGIAYLLSRAIVQAGGVAFGAQMGEDLEVSHISCENIDDLKKLSGSKYLQSKIGNTYLQVKEQLTLGREVLFTGTPCQVKGLRSFLGKEYENLYTLDFICHGVPSLRVFKAMIDEEELQQGETVKGVAFRSKENGWRASTTAITFTDGSVKNVLNMQNGFYRLFLGNYILRNSCYNCESAEVHSSDITVGDFWATNIRDDKGVSLVACATEKGKRLFELIQDQLEVFKIEDKDRLAPCYRAHEETYRKKIKDQFWVKYRKYGYIKCNKIYMRKIRRHDARQKMYQLPKKCLSKLKKLIGRKNG